MPLWRLTSKPEISDLHLKLNPDLQISFHLKFSQYFSLYDKIYLTKTKNISLSWFFLKCYLNFLSFFADCKPSFLMKLRREKKLMLSVYIDSQNQHCIPYMKKPMWVNTFFSRENGAK